MKTKLFTGALTGLFLILLTALFFDSAVFSGGQFFYGDISQNHYPARKLISLLEREGTFPLWNPYITSGQPLYCNPNNLLFHPVSILFLVLPFDAAFKYSIILQFLLCAWGMYLFSRENDLSRSGSILSASLFTFSGFMLSTAHRYNLLCGAAWLPLSLFFLHRSLYRSRRYLILASLSFSILLITAEPFFILSALLISLAVLFLKKPDRPRDHGVLFRVGILVTVLLLAFLLSAFLLLPAFEFFGHSERGAGLASDIVSKWSLRPAEILGLFLPKLFGDPFLTAPSEYWGGFFYRETVPLFASLYMGIPALFFLSFLFFRRDRVLRTFSPLMAVSLILALSGSTPLVQTFFERIPLLSAFRYSSKFFILFVFSFAFLSGRGFDAWREFSERRWKEPVRRWFLLVLPVLLTLFLGALYYAGLFFPGISSLLLENLLHVKGEAGEALLASITSRLLESIVYAAAVSLAATLLLFASLYTRIRSSLAASFFIGIVLLDLLAVNMTLNPAAGTYFYRKESPFSKALPGQRDLFRVYRERTPGELQLRIRSGEREEGFFWNRMMLLQWTGQPYKIPFAFDRNVDRLGPHQHYLLMEKAKERGWEAWKKILDLSGVRYLLLYKKMEDPDLSLIKEHNSTSNLPVALYQNRAALPRLYAVPKVRAVHSGEEALEEVLAESFHPSREAVVLLDPEEEKRWGDLLVERDRLSEAGRETAILDVREPPVSDGQETSVLEAKSAEWRESGEGALYSDYYRLKLSQASCNRMRILIEADRNGFLVLSDSYYPGWRCAVDGQDVPILQTNGLFRGVPFRKGRHAVEFRFQPALFYLGLALSTVSLSAIALFTALAVIREKGK